LPRPLLVEDRDPNGIQLEYSCQTRPFDESDLHGEFEASVAMLD